MYRIISILLIVGLTGCSTTHSKFSCPIANSPIRCQPLSVVDQKINTGALNLPKPKAKQVMKHINSMPIRASHIILATPFANQKEELKPKRIPGSILSVWLAPFVDQNDVYHRQQWLELVVIPARWQGTIEVQQ